MKTQKNIKPTLSWDKIKAILSFLVLLTCLGHTFSAMAQPKMNIAKISIEEGLSSRIVTKIIKDQRDFIWLATSTGLNKYNGYDFTIYNNKKETSNYINGDLIGDIALYKDEKIAINYNFHLKFIDLLDIHTGAVEQVFLNLESGIQGVAIEHFFKEEEGIYILSEDDKTVYIQKYIDDKKVFETIFSLDKKEEGPISSYYFSKTDNDYWLNVSGDLYQWNEQTKKHTSFELSEFKGQKQNQLGGINFIYQDQQKRIWFSCRNLDGVYLFEPSTGQFKLNPLFPKEEDYNIIWEDELGNIILHVYKPNITRVPNRTKALWGLNLENEFVDFSYLLEEENGVECVYGEDFFNTVFLGNYTGFRVISQQKNIIKRIFYNENSIEGKYMWGFAEDENENLYVAREVNNWYKINLETEEVETIYLTDLKTKEQRPFQHSFQLYYEDQCIWGGTFDPEKKQGRLQRLDLKTGIFESFDIPMIIQCFLKSKDGFFWIAVAMGSTTNLKSNLLCFNPNTQKLITYLNADGTNPTENFVPRDIYESEDGFIWLATTNGLIKIDRKQKNSKRFGIKNAGLSVNGINVIYPQNKDIYYLGTDEGLNVFDTKAEQVIKSYNTKNGLGNNLIYSIISHNEKDLWLGTANGLCFFDRAAERFRNFSIKDGLTHPEFNRFSCFKDKKGQLYFGGLNGVNVFYPEALLETQVNPPTRLTKFSKYNSESDVLTEVTTGLDHFSNIEIKPSDAYFEFQFALPDYSPNEKKQYQVWLEGYDKKDTWDYLGNNRSIRYNKLPPGAYKFHFKGADAKGNWSEGENIIQISVAQIFYKTWWFLSLLAIGLFLFAYSLYRYRLQQAINVERLRTRIASDLHDEVGGIMTRISIGSELVKEKVLNPEEEEKELQHISDRSRDASSIMSDVIWSIDARKDKIEDLFDRMREHLQELLPTANIDYTFDVKVSDKEKVLDVDVRQNVYFIFKEAINNIVKHSNATKVDVKLENDRKKFYLRIQDNGSVSPLNTKTGQGLKNMHLRTERIGAVIKIDKSSGYLIIIERKGI